MESAPVGEQRQCRALGQRARRGGSRATAHLKDQLRQVNLRRAIVPARPALNAELFETPRSLPSFNPRRQNRADGARVDLPKHVPPDETVDRAHIQAGGATNALQRLAEQLVFRHLDAAVIVKDHVHLLLPAVRALGRTGKDGNVARDLLRRGAPRERGQHWFDLLEPLHQLLDPHYGDVHRRQRRHQPRVAFIGAQHQAAGFRHGDVGAGDSDLRLEKPLAELLPRHAHQPRDFRLQPLSSFAAEQSGHVVARQMDGRQHHVRRALPRQLHDPLAEVGFPHFDPCGFQRSIQVDLLGCHRLRLHQQARPAPPRHFQDVPAHFVRRLKPHDPRPARGGGPGEPGGQPVQPPGGASLQFGDARAERFKIDPFIGAGAARAVILAETGERGGQVGVCERLAHLLPEFTGHGGPPVRTEE